jgi:hypothetical protein
LPDTYGTPTFHNAFLTSSDLTGYTVAAGSVTTGATHPITRGDTTAPNTTGPVSTRLIQGRLTS